MTSEKEKKTSTLTSDQNQGQREEVSKSQSDQDQDPKPCDKKRAVNNAQQNPSKKTKIEMGERFGMTKKGKINSWSIEK